MAFSLTRLWSTSCLTAALLAIGAQQAHANPVDPTVSAGAATIATAGSTLTVTQTTNKAVIDWNGFDIAAGETTNFIQPSSSSVTLNRVNSSNPSFINGTLTANGNIFIINQNGVLFGSGSRVDVNGLVVSTADITNTNFMAGNFRFDQPGNPNATIENRGLITAQEAGLIGMVAPNVINSGIITARLGRVHLASGDSATVDLYGDGLMEVAVSDAVTSQLVENTGRIQADGGTIALTAAAGSNIVNSLIRVSGELRAPAVGMKNGKIIIAAEGSNAVAGNIAANKGIKTGVSTVLVDGILDVHSDVGTGGEVTITADHIALLNGARVDASGATGGGVVHIGGEYLGGGVTPAALITVVQTGVTIDAGALVEGNGGEVIVYADNRTEFGGNIDASGAGDSGNGGFVETSGKNVLLAFGNVRAIAGRNGKAGTWLLDPADITITAATNSNITGGTPFTATATGSQVAASTIVGLLNAGTNVSIVTSNDGFAGNGDIIVSSAITTTGSGALTLSAYRNITVSSSITLTGGALTLRADNAATGSGAVVISAAIATNGGNITIGGGNGAITAGSGFAVGNAGSSHGVFITNAVSAGGGNIIINGRGFATTTNINSGVLISGASANVSTTGAGTVNITGNGGGITNSGANYGVYLLSGGIVSTVSGLLTVTGTGGGAGTGASNYGVSLETSAIIQTTGGGAITVTGTGGASSGSDNFGVRANSSSIVGSGGAMVITGTGGLSAGNNHYGVLVNSAGGVISNTGTGTLSITGTGGGITNSATNYGVIVDSAGVVSTVNGLLTVTGIGGGAGTGANNYGVYVNAANSSIRTIGTGAISVTGTGGNGTGSGTSNYGVVVQNAAIIQSTGGGAITVNGTGSTSSGSDNFGLRVDGSIVGSGGAMVINGTGGASTGANNYGVVVNGASAAITNTGTGTLNITGTGGGITNSGDNYGVYLLSGGIVSTVNGLLTVTGIGGGAGTGAGNCGVFVGSGSIRTTGTGSLSVTGTGGASAGSLNHGVLVISASAAITNTGTGTLNITGTGGGSGNSGNNIGVYLLDGGIVSTVNGLLTVTGIGGGAGTGASNYGVLVSSANSSIRTTGTGSLSVTGTGGASAGSFNHGVFVTGASAAITNTGAGTLNVTGTGGGSGNSATNIGVYLLSGGIVSTVSGLLTVTGTGGNAAGSGTANHGVSLETSTIIQTTGGGAITVNGTGSASSGGSNYGVYINSSSIVGSGGAMVITGTGGASAGTNNFGVLVINASAAITNTGTGTLNITGTGGGSGNSAGNIGVYLLNGGVSTVNGALTMIGTGGGAGTGGGNCGVLVSSANSSIRTTGTGSLSVTGTGGASAGSFNHGVVVNGASAAITNTGAGTLNVTGTGGGITNSGNNIGLYLLDGGIVSTVNGLLTVTGIGGGAGTGDTNYGVYINATNSTIRTTGTGALSVTGTGGNAAGSGGENHGVFSNIANGIQTTGTGNITVSGIKGGQASSFGTYLSVANGVRSSGTAGNITVLTDTIFLNLANNINSAGSLTIAPYSTGTMAVGTTGSTLNLSNTYLGYINGASYVFGSAAAGDITINTTVDYGNKDVTYRSGRDVIVAGTINKTAGAGTGITLVAGRNFINNVGTPFNVTAGRWLVYSTNPTADTRNGLTASFSRYNCTFGGSCPSFPGTGNGFLYSATANLTVTPTAIMAISYGDAVPTLVGYSYTVSGYLAAGDSVGDVITGILTGSTTYTQGADVGTYGINYVSGTVSGSVSSVLGYTYTYANNASAIVVGQRTLTAGLTGVVSKKYDGNDLATLTAANYNLTNFYGSDAATVSIANMLGTYSDSAAGTGKAVTVTGLTLTGLKSANYTLSATMLTGAIGTIVAAPKPVSNTMPNTFDLNSQLYLQLAQKDVLKRKSATVKVVIGNEDNTNTAALTSQEARIKYWEQEPIFIEIEPSLAKSFSIDPRSVASI